MKVIASFFGLVLIVIVGAATFLGVMPVLSDVLGTNKPRDLGMEFSQEKWDEGKEKTGVEFKELPSDSKDTLKYEGSHEVKGHFSDEILTAHAWNKDWEYYPVKDLQVRINEDDTCEISGIVKLSQLEGFMSEIGVSMEDYKAALDKVGIPMIDMPFYAKGFGTVTNNQMESTVTSFKVGKFSVPQGILDEYQGAVEDFGHTVMANIDGLDVKEAKFEDGSIYFDGTLPNVEYTVPAF